LPAFNNLSAVTCARVEAAQGNIKLKQNTSLILT